jgi:hypothetical protein
MSVTSACAAELKPSVAKASAERESVLIIV